MQLLLLLLQRTKGHKLVSKAKNDKWPDHCLALLIRFPYFHNSYAPKPSKPQRFHIKYCKLSMIRVSDTIPFNQTANKMRALSILTQPRMNRKSKYEKKTHSDHIVCWGRAFVLSECVCVWVTSTFVFGWHVSTKQRFIHGCENCIEILFRQRWWPALLRCSITPKANWWRVGFDSLLKNKKNIKLKWLRFMTLNTPTHTTIFCLCTNKT